MANEEIQMGKIREMMKERNRNRYRTKAQPSKRRKLGDASYSNNNEDPATSSQTEKRKPEEAENAPNSKKAKTRDIRELFRRQEEDDQIAENTPGDGQGDAQHDDPPAEHPAVTGDDQGDAHQGDAQHAHYGELEEVELTN